MASPIDYRDSKPTDSQKKKKKKKKESVLGSIFYLSLAQEKKNSNSSKRDPFNSQCSNTENCWPKEV